MDRQRPPNPRTESPPRAGLGFYAACFFLAVVAALPSPSTVSDLTFLHQVPEGHVGAYWRGGALLSTLTEPGFHLKVPLITHYEPIRVTLQTKEMRDIQCGTNGGVMINFDKIEVVSRLHKNHVYETLLNYGVHYDQTWIYGKVQDEINKFCSGHSLQQVYVDLFNQINSKIRDALQSDCPIGIEIVSVRVIKPTIPETIRRGYERVEEQRAHYYLRMEELRGYSDERIEEQHGRRHVRIEEQRMNDLIAIMESKRNAEVQKSLADSEFYRTMKEAEANKVKLSPEYLELRFIEGIASNSKIYFGNKVANMVSGQRVRNLFQSEAEKGGTEAEF